MTFIIAVIYTKSYLGASKMLIFFILIVIIPLNVFMVNELISMTKDMPAVITGKYVENKFYVTDIRRSFHKNIIISEYVTAEDYNTGELKNIEFYYDSKLSKGEIKIIKYLPNCHKCID
jgi:hypothetical protein